MKIVNSSVNLASYLQLKYMYLLAVAFLVTIAFGSNEVERSSRSEENTTRETDFMRLKREVLDALHTGLKREVLDALRTERTISATNGGAVYIRWGRNVCGPGSDAVYRGVAGGSSYDHTGGGSNYLCLPHDPIWGAYNEGVEKYSDLYGSEYQYPSGFGLNNNHYLPLHDNNVPCVVCRSQTKTSVVMTPARNQCYGGWNTEYNGYLMSSASVHPGRTEFICMDGQPESVPQGFRNENGVLFYNVKGVCGSLPCPPFAERREITCAVCTK